jgi:hypothetical protein
MPPHRQPARCRPRTLEELDVDETVGPRTLPRAMVVLAARRSVVGPFLLAGGIGRTMTGMGTSLVRGRCG